jgi:hypothetical protein
MNGDLLVLCCVLSFFFGIFAQWCWTKIRLNKLLRENRRLRRILDSV